MKRSRKFSADGMVGYLMVFAVAALFLNYIAWLTGSLLFQTTNQYYLNESDYMTQSISGHTEAACLFVSEAEDNIISGSRTVKLIVPGPFRNTGYKIEYLDGKVYFNTTTQLPGLGIVSSSGGVNDYKVTIRTDIRDLEGPLIYIIGHQGDLPYVYIGGNRNG